MGYWIRLGILFTVYAVTAKLGLQAHAVAGFASLVWPPTGIALVAIVLGGYRLWPAIAGAAFVVNFTTGAPAWVAALMGAGNTLEAVLGAYLLQRIARFQPSLTRVRDVLALVIFAALISPLVSATVGVTGLWLGNLLGAESFLNAWATWWLGDAMGSIIVAPLLLVWARQPRIHFTPSRLAEGMLLAGVLIGVSLLVFQGPPGAGRNPYLSSYLVFPALIWAALRFDPRGAATALVTVSALAIWGAQRGRGPFFDPVLQQSLLSLQLYMGITTTTMLTLAAAMAEMRSAIRTRDDFLSIASHELNTPVTALKMQVELIVRMTRKAGQVDPEKLSRLSERAGQQITRLTRLVDTLLDVARISVGRLTLVVEEVELGQVVRDVTAELQGPGAPPITIDAQPGIVGRWDRLRIEQVVANLVTNAIKYGAGKPVIIKIWREGESGFLSVQDQGIGIPPSRLPFIFERFERAVSDRNYSGLGLGLYICRQIAEAHGGSIRVRSRLGEGACFTVRLPLN